MKSNCKLISLEELVKDRFFEIPDYQRGFSWEEKHLNDLRKDIENMFDKDHRHFMGTIVATKKEGFNNVYEVIDGQQRLTTLIILIKKMIDSDSGKYQSLKEIFIQRGEVGDIDYVLRTNQETWEYFHSLIYKNQKKVQQEYKSHQYLLDATKFFENWFEEAKSHLDLILKIVTEKLGFILFTPTNSEDIGIMFEVINNRGKGLSELEKIKNYFIYYSTIYSKKSLRENINQKWGPILKNLNKAGVDTTLEEDNFLRYCYLLFFKASKSKSHHVYQDLKELFDPHLLNKQEIDDNIQLMDRFIDFIESASLHYAYLLNTNKFFENHYKGKEKSLCNTLEEW